MLHVQVLPSSVSESSAGYRNIVNNQNNPIQKIPKRRFLRATDAIQI